jgi:hypothetical protein
MIITPSEAASNAMLDQISRMLDGGRIELLSDDERVLAVLKLSDPAARDAVDGELVLNSIAEEDAALAQGICMSARVLSADGDVVFACDVGDENSDAVVRLNTTKIFRGGPVRLNSFRLIMPFMPEE